MRTKKKLKVSPAIRAREVLAFAEERAKTAANSAEFSNSLYAPGGKASESFPTERERAAFMRTKEYRRILALEAKLPNGPHLGTIEVVPLTKGSLYIRVAQTVHDALADEAKAEGVTLEQLCLTKLAAPLRRSI
jgi:hypothetical protein